MGVSAGVSFVAGGRGVVLTAMVFVCLYGNIPVVALGLLPIAIIGYCSISILITIDDCLFDFFADFHFLLRYLST